MIWYDISLYNPFWWWCYRFCGRHALGVSAEMAHLCAGSSVKSSFAEVFSSKGLGHLSSVFRQDQHVFISGLFYRLFSLPFPTSTTLSNCSLADLGFRRAHRSTWSHATWSTSFHWTTGPSHSLLILHRSIISLSTLSRTTEVTTEQQLGHCPKDGTSCNCAQGNVRQTSRHKSLSDSLPSVWFCSVHIDIVCERVLQTKKGWA